METFQDLLAPEKVNIPIVEDAKTGEVLLPGASVIKIHDLNHFMELLQHGEANRHAANTKLNTNSSRSHAILMVRSGMELFCLIFSSFFSQSVYHFGVNLFQVSVKRSIIGKAETDVRSTVKVTGNEAQLDVGVNMIRKGKLLIVDLAGSERIDKSGKLVVDVYLSISS